MAVTAVPARPTIAEEWWFGFIVRAALALLALWILAFAGDRQLAFENDFRANFEMAKGMWLAWIAPTIVTGFLFGLATWLPFAKVRYLWSRLLLAALALAPIAQFWWLFFEGHAAEVGWRWLYHADWLLYPPFPKRTCGPGRRGDRLGLQDGTVSERRGVAASIRSRATYPNTRPKRRDVPQRADRVHSDSKGGDREVARWSAGSRGWVMPGGLHLAGPPSPALAANSAPRTRKPCITPSVHLPRVAHRKRNP